jgi:3',5'-cyclic AMP phosphodiesterase CpdA
MLRNSKIFFAFYISFVVILITGCTFDKNKQEALESGEDISMFVATDIHYLAKTLNDNGEAFQTYFSTGDGKQLNYIGEITDAFLNDMEKEKPDILVISGDLTNNGEKESHLELAKKLKHLEKTTGTRVFVIPGNHDIQNPWARGFRGKEQYVTDSVDANGFESIYKELGYKEAVSRDTSTLSYLAAPSKDVWLLMLDTNVYKNNYEYGAPVTYGEINHETYEWIRECSNLAKENNAKIVTVMHHSLLNHSMVINYGFTLDNNKEALKVFRECGLNLVLSGHIHIQDIKFEKEETNPIYDIATSSLSVYPIQYGILNYVSTKGFQYKTQRVDVEGWADKTGVADENLLNFSQYNKEFFASVTYKNTYDALEKADIYSKEDMKLMAETMSLLNQYYFPGTASLIREEVLQTEGYKLWRNASEPEMLTRYVRSMVYDYNIDNNEIEIR